MGWGSVVLADSSGQASGIGILVGVLAALSIMLFFAGLQRSFARRPNSVNARLDDFVGPAQQAGSPARGRRERRQRVAPAYGEIESGFTARMARELAQADLRITVGEYLALTGVLASVGALLGFALPIAGRFLLSLVLLLAGLYGPYIYVRSKRRARQAAFTRELPDMLSLMSGSMRAGYSLLQAMELAAREGPAPAGPEFDRVVREVGLGLSPEEALNNLLQRMESEDMVLFVTAVNVQREVGGNMAEILDSIAFTIRERVKLVAQVSVMTAQQQFSGYVVALLPVALGLLLTILNPSYMLGLFQTTIWCGWTMVGCSLVMIVTGFLIIRRIVAIQV